ncbi:hypothetical protein VTK56DRAFT_9987 [Thermocarpiscus australiensis]
MLALFHCSSLAQSLPGLRMVLHTCLPESDRWVLELVQAAAITSYARPSVCNKQQCKPRGSFLSISEGLALLTSKPGNGHPYFGFAFWAAGWPIAPVSPLTITTMSTTLAARNRLRPAPPGPTVIDITETRQMPLVSGWLR